MRGWWYGASTDQRLAQIDGCISVGMTVKQCSMNLGTNRHTLWSFARRHGRHFELDAYKESLKADKRSIAHNNRRNFEADKKAYLAGEPVDFWSVQ